MEFCSIFVPTGDKLYDSLINKKFPLIPKPKGNSTKKKEDEEKKDAIKNMKKTLNYLQKSYQDMAVFKSSYEIGAEYEGEE